MVSYINDKCALELAGFEAKKSLCTRRKYGAVLVSNRGEMLSSGFNCISDDDNCIINGCPRDKNNSEHNTHDYTGCNSIHAEMMALLSCNSCEKICGSTIYLVGFDNKGKRIDNAMPCPNCLKHIKFVNIKKLVNYSGEYYL